MPRAARRRGELVQRHGLPAFDDEAVDSLAAAKHLARIVDRHCAPVAERARDLVHHAVIDERFGPVAESGHAGDLAAIVETVRVDDRRGAEVAKRSVLVHEELAARDDRDLSVAVDADRAAGSEVGDDCVRHHDRAPVRGADDHSRIVDARDLSLEAQATHGAILPNGDLAVDGSRDRVVAVDCVRAARRARGRRQVCAASVRIHICDRLVSVHRAAANDGALRVDGQRPRQSFRRDVHHGPIGRDRICREGRRCRQRRRNPPESPPHPRHSIDRPLRVYEAALWSIRGRA